MTSIRITVLQLSLMFPSVLISNVDFEVDELLWYIIGAHLYSQLFNFYRFIYYGENIV